jgi:small subunit ribosomal protein S6
MPMNIYELMFLMDLSKVEADVPAAVGQLHATLQKHQAEILASRPWDTRKPAYPVKNLKKSAKGLYYLIYIRCDSKRVPEMEQDFKLNESIVRMLVIHIEPKLVDEMLAVAQDEHALALQTAHDEGIDGVDGYEMPGHRMGGDKD